MDSLAVGDNKIKEASRRFVAVCNKWWFAHLLRPFLFLIPVTGLTYLITRKELQENIRQLLGDTVGGFVQNSPFLALVLLLIFVAIAKAIYAAIESYSRPRKELNFRDVVAILIAINGVVSEKYSRFSTHARETLDGAQRDPGQIFLSITQPEKQVRFLVAGIRNVFLSMDDTRAQFRVGLLRIIDGRPRTTRTPNSGTTRTPTSWDPSRTGDATRTTWTPTFRTTWTPTF